MLHPLENGRLIHQLITLNTSSTMPIHCSFASHADIDTVLQALTNKPARNDHIDTCLPHL